MNNELMERIEKLLALANSQNENEAKVAMLKAQKLMAENNIKMEAFGDKKDIEIDEFIFNDVSWTTGSWKIRLCTVICDNFKCKAYSTSGRVKNPVIFGDKKDIEVVKTVYTYACNIVEHNIKQIKEIYKRTKQSVRGIDESYGVGFVHGLREQFEEQKSKNQQWGLVLKVPENEIKEYLTHKKYAEKTCRGTSVRHNRSDMYNMGRKDGKSFTTHKGIE